jgi:hypothetical protein
MKAKIDKDGFLQLIAETNEEKESIRIWMDQSIKDLEDGSPFPKIECSLKIKNLMPKNYAE